MPEEPPGMREIKSGGRLSFFCFVVGKRETKGGATESPGDLLLRRCCWGVARGGRKVNRKNHGVYLGSVVVCNILYIAMLYYNPS